MKKLAIASVILSISVGSNVFAQKNITGEVIGGQAIINDDVFKEEVVLSFSNNVIGAYDLHMAKNAGMRIGACHKAGGHKRVLTKCMIYNIISGSFGDRIVFNDYDNCHKPGEEFELYGARVALSSNNGGSVVPANVHYIDNECKEWVDVLDTMDKLTYSYGSIWAEMGGWPKTRKK